MEKATTPAIKLWSLIVFISLFSSIGLRWILKQENFSVGVIIASVIASLLITASLMVLVEKAVFKSTPMKNSEIISDSEIDQRSLFFDQSNKKAIDKSTSGIGFAINTAHPAILGSIALIVFLFLNSIALTIFKL